MNDHKNGGCKSAPVQTGHDHRAGKREHSDAVHMPTPDAVPKSKGARAGRHLRLLGIRTPGLNGSICFRPCSA